jgi:redox-sensitive bicupin YhaK (pirin superfamily)
MLAGSMEHRDHRGNHGLLVAGSAQWMTAGRGLVHSEMPKQEDGLMWGFQLWVNLPASHKMIEPRYQDIPPERIPERRLPDGTRVRVVAGGDGDLAGPVSGIVTDPLYLDVALPPGTRWERGVPAGHACVAYVFEGRVEVGEEGRALEAGELAVLEGGDTFACGTPSGGRLLLLAARPLNEPIARYGPFVMNTREEIAQAFADFRAGTF